jgi:hypothetical protein
MIVTASIGFTTLYGQSDDTVYVPLVANGSNMTAVATSTPIRSPEPTKTLTPTSTPTPTATSTPTVTPTPTATSTPTVTSTFTATPTDTPEPERWTALFLSSDEKLETSTNPNVLINFFLYPFPEYYRTWTYELKGDITNTAYQFHLNMRGSGPVTVQAEILLNDSTLVTESFDVDVRSIMQFNRIVEGIDPDGVAGDILTLKMSLTAEDSDDVLVISSGSFPNYSNLAVALENP